MARAHFVKSARKPIPSAGIKAGDSYYWWQFRNCPKSYSKEPPKASQLTRSEFLSALYEIQERVANLPASSDLPGMVEEIAGELNELADAQEEKKDNMPDALQEADTGQLLQARADACRSAAEELEGLDLSEWVEDTEAEEDCTSCEGTGKAEDGGDCDACQGAGKDKPAEPCNSDGETEQEYWEAKLEEVQQVGINEE